MPRIGMLELTCAGFACSRRRSSLAGARHAPARRGAERASRAKRPIAAMDRQRRDPLRRQHAAGMRRPGHASAQRAGREVGSIEGADDAPSGCSARQRSASPQGTRAARSSTIAFLHRPPTCGRGHRARCAISASTRSTRSTASTEQIHRRACTSVERLQRSVARFKPYSDKPNARRMPDDLAEEMVRTRERACADAGMR